VSVSVNLIGIEAFRAALRNLPETLRQEADVVVQAQADAMAREAQQAYPEGPTGNLRRGVTVRTLRSSYSVAAQVRSRAPHAHIFEQGTKVRRTDKGYNRGAMPQASDADRFVPKAIRARRRLTSALIDIVRRAGFEVNA